MNDRIIIILLFGCLLFGGCRRDKETANTDLQEYLGKFIGQELKLPSDSSCHFYGKSYGVDYLNADYIILSYIEAKDCTPCHLKLPYWKELNEQLDTLSNVYATSILIIQPDTLEKVTTFLDNAEYDFPIIVDTVGRWSKINNLPEEQFFHSLLVDKTGKILSLGNPIENEAIRQLYLRIITGNTSQQATESPLEIKRNKIDFGTIPSNATRNLEFIVRNKSNEKIEVDRWMTPCDCVDVSATDIEPNSVGKINIHFDASNTRGTFHFPIIVRYKSIDAPIIIHLYGMVSL